MIVDYQLTRTLMDRRVLAFTLQRSPHMVRLRCPVAERRNGVALYDLEVCADIFAKMVVRPKSADGRLQRVLDAIVASMDSDGRMPTVKALAETVGLPQTTAWEALRQLEKQGHLRRRGHGKYELVRRVAA